MIDLPVYETKLPVSNKKIKFSPLTVKQEKNIGAAKQTGGNAAGFITFLEIMKEKIDTDISKLSEPDLIHCILELRKFSVGEKFKTTFVCPHSKRKVTKEVDCNSIAVSGKKKQSTVTDMGYTIKIKIPKKQNFSELTEPQKENQFNDLPIKVKNEVKEELNNLFHYEYELNYESDTNHTIKVRSAEDFFILLFVM